MASPFAFVPRKVAKLAKPTVQIPSSGSAQPHTALNRPVVNAKDDQPSNHNAKSRPKAESKGKTKYSDVDYAHLICLALSDYALWSNPDLRRKIDLSASEDDGRGFIPLSYLLRHSPITAGLELGHLQTAIVKALREHAVDFLEVRLLVSQPSLAGWYGSDTARDSSGYEICRKVQKEAIESHTKRDWEERTLYMERIPVQYRTIPGILHFTLALFPAQGLSSYSLTRVQNISLPPHHQDKPGDMPTCKGFALVTLAASDDFEHLLTTWHWDKSPDVDSEPQTEHYKEAKKFGFRTVSKQRWDALKDEYLAYREKIIEEINASQDAESSNLLVSSGPSNQNQPQNRVTEPTPEKFLVIPPTANAIAMDPTSPYPFNCLVLVRNLHPETNKTTLRSLFSKAFESAEDLKGDGLDYLDYNKGTDACYLRFSTPIYARKIVNFFSERNIVQTVGLDATGSVDSTRKAIVAEPILGRREELYWDKVPEKIRRQAVEKAISLVTGGILKDEDTLNDKEDKSRKRKKRKTD